MQLINRRRITSNHILTITTDILKSLNIEVLYDEVLVWVLSEFSQNLKKYSANKGEQNEI